jgi:hypothetical protein
LFPLFILFSRKKKLIGVIDGMTQKERDIDVPSKRKLIGVTDDTSRKEKQRKNHCMIRCTKERFVASFCQW